MKATLATPRQGKCLVIGLIILAVFIVAGVWFYNYATSGKLVADGIDVASEALLEEFAGELPAEEREAALDVVHTFTNRVREGEVSMEQALNVGFVLTTDALPMILGRVFEETYVKKSDLSAEEKTAAQLTLARFFRGTIEERIPQQDFDAVVAQFSREVDGETVFDENIPDDKLRSILAEMKALADRGGVTESMTFDDLPTMLQKAIDRGLESETLTKPEAA